MQDDPNWNARLDSCSNRSLGGPSLHLAVFVEPSVNLLMSGRKSIESRFSLNAAAPFKQLFPGDLVLLKRSGEEVVGIGRVGQVRHYERSECSWEKIRQAYQEQLCATEDEFWNRISDAGYASLIWFDQVRALPPIDCDKQDRRGWVVIKRATNQMCLEF